MMDFLRRLFPPKSPVRKSWYFLKAVLAAVIYGYPAKKLIMIGVTGTDGKTTTIEMISRILEEAKIPHLMLSTVSISLNGKRVENDTKRTTMSPFRTQKLLKEAVDSNAEVAVIEVSSHAIDQYRLWGIRFDLAGVTNITEEHLDDHGGFVKYAALKERLFTDYLKDDGTAFLNRDDDVTKGWDIRVRAKKVWYSTQDSLGADAVANYFEKGDFGIRFQIRNKTVEIPIPGDYNMENALLAYLITEKVGISHDLITSAFRKFSGVKGRLERVDCGQNFDVFIDFAVTPNALKKMLLSLKELRKKSLFVVFGCTGDRDKSKRSKMGQIAGNIADFVILTDDEPYTESAEVIREQVKYGLAQSKVWREGDQSPHFWEIPDRKMAITFAIQKAGEGDSIVISGIGAESSRNIGGKEVPWSDLEIVKEVFHGLRKINPKIFEMHKEETKENLKLLQKKLQS